MATYARVGGVHADLPRGFEAKARKAIKKIRLVIDECDTLLTTNRIFVDRMRGVGTFTLEQAKSYGWSGPLLRACGLAYDVRKAQPYFKYDEVDFEVPVRADGDNYSRYLTSIQPTCFGVTA